MMTPNGMNWQEHIGELTILQLYDLAIYARLKLLTLDLEGRRTWKFWMELDKINPRFLQFVSAPDFLCEIALRNSTAEVSMCKSCPIKWSHPYGYDEPCHSQELLIACKDSSIPHEDCYTISNINVLEVIKNIQYSRNIMINTEKQK